MWALQDVRLPTGAAADIVVDGDRIARLEAGAADGLAERIQCSGKLVLPGFIERPVHLDKVLIRDGAAQGPVVLAQLVADQDPVEGDMAVYKTRQDQLARALDPLP